MAWNIGSWQTGGTDIGAAQADASSGVTGTGSATLPAITGAGSGAQTNSGSGAGVLPAITGSGSGVQSISGTGSGTLPSLTGSGSGTQTTSGTGAGTLPLLTGAGSGNQTNSGSGAGALPLLTGAGAGSATDNATGSGAGTLPLITGSGAGSQTVNGTGSGVLPLVTGAGAGVIVQPISGTGSGVLPLLTGAGAGSQTLSGSGSGALPLLTGSGTGVASDTRTGTGAGVFPLLTGSGSGVQTNSGSGAGVLPILTGSGSGSVIGPATGTGAGTLPMLTGAGSGLAGAVSLGISDLTTVARVAARREVEGTADDALLQEFVTSVSQTVANLMGRPVLEAQRTEIVKLRQHQRVVTLDARPIASVLSVTVNSRPGFAGTTAADPSSYGVLDQQGQIVLGGGAPYSPTYVRVIYTAGMAPTTASFVAAYPELADAVDVEVVNRWNRRKSPEESEISLGDGAVGVIDEYGLHPHLLDVVSQYRVREV